jgi:hypothetical protein
MSRDELIEILAAIEHERWSDWQKYMHGGGERVLGEGTYHCSGGSFINGGDLVLLASDVARWDRQIATPYADLTEREKQSDRDQVMRYWPLIAEFVAEWIEQREVYDTGFAVGPTAAQWREDMSS